MSSKRMLQVGQAIREHIANMIARGEVADPRVRFVTIQSVTMTADLQTARVYVSVLGDDKALDFALRGLRQASGFIRRSVGQKLGIRYTPEILFFGDETAEKAARIERLFAKIHEAEGTGLPPTDLPAPVK